MSGFCVRLTSMILTGRRLLPSDAVSKTALAWHIILVTLLFFSVIPVNQFALAQSTSPPVTVETDNNSVSIIVNWTPEEIQAGEDVDVSLEFQNPTSGQTLSHVNYELKVIDPSSGETIKSIDGIHTHSGQDAQTVKLDNMGDFTLEITVIGLGINQPFDTTRSGTAQTAIVVVPEFPFALIAMAAGIAIVIIVVRSRYSSLPRFPTGMRQ